MIDGSEKRNRQLAFELQNSHVCEKRSKRSQINNTTYKNKGMGELEEDCGFHKLQCLPNCFSSPFYCNRLI